MSAAGCFKVWAETASGATTTRPQLMDLLSHLRDGDTLVVWRLDRLERSLRHLLQTVEDLAARGVGFKSLTEAIDTTTSRGKLIFSYLRRTRRIRTQPDPRTHPSRPRRRTSPHRRPAPEDAIDETRTGTTYAGKWNALIDIAEIIGVGRTTLYRHFK